MAVKVKMPKWGMTMEEGIVLKWLKKEGDSVHEGDDLVEVEAAKITNIIQSTADGILFQITASEGMKVPVGTTLAIIAEPGEQPDRVKAVGTDKVSPEPPPPANGQTRSQPEGEPKKKFVPASPAARRLAKELGIDLSLIQGSGPNGRIIEADVTKSKGEGAPSVRITPLAKKMAQEAGLDESEIVGSGEAGKITKKDVESILDTREGDEKAKHPESIAFSGMRKAIADNMFSSLQNSAQLTLFSEVDVTDLCRFRDLFQREHQKEKEIRISYNDLLVLAASRVLKQFPHLNAALLEDKILLYDSVNIGIAVALPEGLIVPVLCNADKKNLVQIAKEGKALAQKAREGILGVEDVSGGTFTITNLGMFGVEGFTPILRQPETGILGVGSIKEKPAVQDGKITIRSMMFLSLTFDHRVVDGAMAGSFLKTLARYIENPMLLFV